MRYSSDFSGRGKLSETVNWENDVGVLAECAPIKIGADMGKYKIVKLDISWNDSIIQRPDSEWWVYPSMKTSGRNNRYRGLIKRWWSDPFTGTYRRHHFRSLAQMLGLNWVKIAQPNHQKIVGRLALIEKKDLLTKERFPGMQPPPLLPPLPTQTRSSPSLRTEVIGRESQDVEAEGHPGAPLAARPSRCSCSSGASTSVSAWRSSSV